MTMYAEWHQKARPIVGSVPRPLLSENGSNSSLTQGNNSLPVLPEIELALTANQVFGWSKMGRSVHINLPWQKLFLICSFNGGKALALDIFCDCARF
ncbi:MAG: hypothetical protein JOZ78_18630 [Chroococcidiopsidaceae cyanobacterium CP_BM_ER_R8_30]|nr:hypothetical protein [Chroococcidiopsidaceae cyanobacterium CP_BM_ER_R8_30]